jgi:hypothetical protein
MRMDGRPINEYILKRVEVVGLVTLKEKYKCEDFM